MMPFWRKAHLHRRIIESENSGEHRARIARGKLPGICLPLFRCQFSAVPQGYCNTGWVDEQIVFREKAGEEHSVPLLISHLLDQLGIALVHVPIPQLARS